jgi:hypothetical protein
MYEAIYIYNYEDLFSCFHKYLLTYLYYVYDYYDTIIFVTIDFTRSQIMLKVLKIDILILIHKFI